jgi:hypoxanthine-guanine phosphoribosyltransferase
LLDKKLPNELKYPVKFTGFDCPNEFVVGYGLDHAENFRHVPYIVSLL